MTSDAGALLLREVDHRLGLTADLAAGLYDPRDPDRIRYEQVELLHRPTPTCAWSFGSDRRTTRRGAFSQPVRAWG